MHMYMYLQLCSFPFGEIYRILFIIVTQRSRLERLGLGPWVFCSTFLRRQRATASTQFASASKFRS